jgi:hypothetical protein
MMDPFVARHLTDFSWLTSASMLAPGITKSSDVSLESTQPWADSTQ